VIKKKSLSKEDRDAWNNFIKNPTHIYDKDKTKSSKGLNKKVRYKFDLHGFTLNNANKKIKEIIEFCLENKFKEILLITGKGSHSKNDQDIFVSKEFGKLKHSVPDYLKSNPDLNKYILSINEAELRDGGEGALVIKLRSIK
tara:strand:+ start:133 stop:558 length:426 start_codon:yes stop_codon:yes gene_type:complete